MEKDLIADIFKEIGFSHKIVSLSSDEYGQVDIEINCNISDFVEISKFIEAYTKYTNETLKVKWRKKITEKSIYSERVLYRCHHDTRYENTRGAKSILEKKKN